MYVEYWCEEKFGNLSLGDPDFSYHDMVRIRNACYLLGIIELDNIVLRLLRGFHLFNQINISIVVYAY